MKFTVYRNRLSTIKCLFLLFIACCINLANSQIIYSCNSKFDADIKIFVVDSKFEADLIVFKLDSKFDAKENKGLWFFTENKFEADKKVYFTDSKFDADLLIWFAESKFDAGWRKKEKIYIL